MRFAWPRAGKPAVGSAVHSPACRRPGAVGSLCDGHSLACARQPCRPHRHRPGSRRDGNSGGSSGVGVARDQVREPAASDKLGIDDAGPRQDRARHHQVVSHLLRRQEAGCGDGPALWRLRPARRSGVRCRRTCRRSHRLVPATRRAGRRRRAAACDGEGSQAALSPQQIRRDRGAGGGARAGQRAHADQRRQPHGVFGLCGVCRSCARRAGLGNPALERRPSMSWSPHWMH